MEPQDGHGYYKVVKGGQPLRTLVTHTTDGPGIFGGVYAESPDRIWVAMARRAAAARRRSWTPMGRLIFPRNSNGNSDGLTQRASRRRSGMGAPLRALDHRIRSPGQPVDEWPTSTSCSPNFLRSGPHQIKSAPTTKKSTLWIIDDQLHMIYALRTT